MSNGPMNIQQLAERLDQSIADFKVFIEQRFRDQDAARHTERVADNRLLDERFKTQTTTLDAAFAAAEKARQEALRTAQEASTRTDARIKDVEDRLNSTQSRGLGRADVWGWVIAGAAVVISLVIYLK